MAAFGHTKEHRNSATPWNDINHQVTSQRYAQQGQQRIDPTQQMYHLYLRFCSFGKGHRVPAESLKMDSRTLLKFCRDGGLLDDKLDRTRVDLIFTKFGWIALR